MPVNALGKSSGKICSSSRRLYPAASLTCTGSMQKTSLRSQWLLLHMYDNASPRLLGQQAQVKRKHARKRKRGHTMLMQSSCDAHVSAEKTFDALLHHQKN